MEPKNGKETLIINYENQKNAVEDNEHERELTPIYR